MTVGNETLDALREELNQQAARINALEAERAVLIETCQSVYAYLVEPNPKNQDPAPWDVVGNGHPIRIAATQIVDTLVSLGIEG